MNRSSKSYMPLALVATGLFVALFWACSSPAEIDVEPVGGGKAANGGSNSSGGTRPGQGGTSGTGTGIIVLPDASVTPVNTASPDASGALASEDANCGSSQTKLQKKPADLLLVLDRSGSMTRGMDSRKECYGNSTTCSQRWEAMVSSLKTVLTSSPADVHWGLKLFASPQTTTSTGGYPGGFPGFDNMACEVSTGVEVPVATGNASEIQKQIAAARPGSNTPTRLAIEAAVAYLKTVSDGNNKYILLATDGEPNCAPGSNGSGGSDLEGTLTALKNAAAAGYKVYVIGVGPEVSNLTSMAQAGGTEKFYSATTPQALSEALTTIVGSVAAGCTYTLPSVPVTPNAVGVYIDKKLIPMNNGEGWGYVSGSTTTIQINGSLCTDLKSGTKTLVEIFLPCAPSDRIPDIIF